MILEMGTSVGQAESIASHIMILILRSLDIREVSEVRLIFQGLENIDEGRLEEIVDRLASYNAGQLLHLSGIDIDEIDDEPLGPC